MNIKNNKNCKITINDEEITVSEKEKTADELLEELGYKKKYLNIQWYIKKLFKNNYTQIIFDVIGAVVFAPNASPEIIDLFPSNIVLPKI